MNKVEPVARGGEGGLIISGRIRGREITVDIRLLSLPPYSPESNPMENVRDHLRQNKPCAAVWNTCDEILEACKTAWNRLIGRSGSYQFHRRPRLGVC